VSAPVFLHSAARPSDFAPDEGFEVAIVGRSNSGKSTALNCITGVAKLARVSKTPGRTQLINFFALAEERRLADLPGYGFARVPAETRRRWQTLVESYLANRRSLAGLLITIDVRRGVTELDEHMLGFARELEIPVFLLVTKADKLSRSAAAAQRQRIESAAGGAQAILFSALTKQGVDEARNQVRAWLKME
jgi:GTP-binding protein